MSEIQGAASTVRPAEGLATGDGSDGIAGFRQSFSRDNRARGGWRLMHEAVGY
jgi:hypothetical protein